MGSRAELAQVPPSVDEYMISPAAIPHWSRNDVETMNRRFRDECAFGVGRAAPTGWRPGRRLDFGCPLLRHGP